MANVKPSRYRIGTFHPHHFCAFGISKTRGVWGVLELAARFFILVKSQRLMSNMMFFIPFAIGLQRKKSEYIWNVPRFCNLSYVKLHQVYVQETRQRSHP
uniref:Uncharacterized protein n=1 Tax=Schistocephalus solidus TaxID=70667 RepID=A0A0X3PRE8_SCHSO